MAVPDRDEVVLQLEVREVNLLVGRLFALAAVMVTAVPLGFAVWPT